MRADLEELFRIASARVDDPELRAQIIEANLDDVPEDLFDEDDEATEERKVALSMLIREMSLPQKIKLALLGGQTARGILIRDTNRMIPQYVLENPKITENEVLDFAKNTQTDDQVLRLIGNNSSWTKSYALKYALVSNPKTPIDVALKWLKFLQEKDLGRLAKSKNVPQVVSSQCRKLLDKKGP